MCVCLCLRECACVSKRAREMRRNRERERPTLKDLRVSNVMEMSCCPALTYFSYANNHLPLIKMSFILPQVYFPLETSLGLFPDTHALLIDSVLLLETVYLDLYFYRL